MDLDLSVREILKKLTENPVGVLVNKQIEEHLHFNLASLLDVIAVASDGKLDQAEMAALLRNPEVLRFKDWWMGINDEETYLCPHCWRGFNGTAMEQGRKERRLAIEADLTMG